MRTEGNRGVGENEEDTNEEEKFVSCKNVILLININIIIIILLTILIFRVFHLGKIRFIRECLHVLYSN